MRDPYRQISGSQVLKIDFSSPPHLLLWHLLTARCIAVVVLFVQLEIENAYYYRNDWL